MQNFAKIIAAAGTLLLTGMLYLASVQGWGLSSLTDRQALSDQERTCPDYEKDQYGNCPPRSHRTRLGSRNFYGGGGK